MTKYREIIRLNGLDFSARKIAESCNVSRNTVSKVLARAKECQIEWPLDVSWTDSRLEEVLFPKQPKARRKREPDYNYIRKELLRNGVNKKLLWVEYCEECKLSGEEPLMYSQFCHYIQDNEQKRRATMHIQRRPAEQVEVDWAGDPAQIIDPSTGEVTEVSVFVGALSYSQYAYAEAFIDEKQKSWITAHVHMLAFFGGVAVWT